MGCDIHPRIEIKEPGMDWRVLFFQEDTDRNYLLFALMADVRNFFKDDQKVEPIDLPRGEPEGHTFFIQERHWLGDHSKSWLSGDEILFLGRRYDEEAEKKGFTWRPKMLDIWIAIVNECKKADCEFRLVFGFDS